MPTILAILLTIVGFLLMFVILLQRGRGGGLAGALGGAGGQSAFGTKAGDVFTKITVIMAVVWVLLAGGTGIAMYKGSTGKFTGADEPPAIKVPLGTEESDSSRAGLLEPNTGTEKQPATDESDSTETSDNDSSE